MTFADGTLFNMALCTLGDTKETLDKIMRDVRYRMEAKQIKFNENKCEYLLVGKKNDLKRLSTATLLMHGTAIKVKN